MVIKLIPSMSREAVMLETVRSLGLCHALSIVPQLALARGIDKRHSAVVMPALVMFDALVANHAAHPSIDSTWDLVDGMNALVEVCVSGE